MREPNSALALLHTNQTRIEPNKNARDQQPTKFDLIVNLTTLCGDSRIPSH